MLCTHSDLKHESQSYTSKDSKGEISLRKTLLTMATFPRVTSSLTHMDERTRGEQVFCHIITRVTQPVNCTKNLELPPPNKETFERIYFLFFQMSSSHPIRTTIVIQGVHKPATPKSPHTAPKPSTLYSIFLNSPIQFANMCFSSPVNSLPCLKGCVVNIFCHFPSIPMTIS